MVTDPVSERIARGWPLVSSAAALVAVLGLGALILARGNTAIGLDETWMAAMLRIRNPALDAIALAFNAIGGGWIALIAVPVCSGGALLIARRPWSALFVVLALLATHLATGEIKLLYSRPRPVDALLQIGSGSFPSGHVSNAAALATVAVLLWPRVWVVVASALYVVAMAFSRTYLGVHWLTDTAGGLLLGAAVAVMVWAPFARRVALESRQARPITSSP